MAIYLEKGIHTLSSWYYNDSLVNGVKAVSRDLLDLINRIKEAILHCLDPRQRRLKELQQAILTDCENYKKNIDIYKFRIYALDQLVINNAEIRTMVAARLKQKQENGSGLKAATVDNYEPCSTDTEIDTWGKLGKELISLEYEWTKRVTLIGMSPNIKSKLIEHMISSMDAPVPTKDGAYSRLIMPLLVNEPQ